MKGNDILALLDEPACEHNHKQKSGCSAPNPARRRAVAPSTARKSPCCHCQMWRTWSTDRLAAREAPGITGAV
jgi:hypothetical protein